MHVLVCMSMGVCVHRCVRRFTSMTRACTACKCITHMYMHTWKKKHLRTVLLLVLLATTGLARHTQIRISQNLLAEEMGKTAEKTLHAATPVHNRHTHLNHRRELVVVSNKHNALEA